MLDTSAGRAADAQPLALLALACRPCSHCGDGLRARPSSRRSRPASTRRATAGPSTSRRAPTRSRQSRDRLRRHERDARVHRTARPPPSSTARARPAGSTSTREKTRRASSMGSPSGTAAGTTVAPSDARARPPPSATASSRRTQVWSGGGAIHANSTSDPRVEACVFTNNCAQFGGAMYMDGSYGTVRNCTFSANSAAGWGGAVFSNTWPFFCKHTSTVHLALASSPPG